MALHALPTHRRRSHRLRPLPQYAGITSARTASTCTAAALPPTLDAAASPPDGRRRPIVLRAIAAVILPALISTTCTLMHCRPDGVVPCCPQALAEGGGD